MQNGDTRKEQGELSETELDGVAGGFNPFSKDDWKKAGNTVVNAVVDTAHDAYNGGKAATQAAAQQAQAVQDQVLKQAKAAQEDAQRILKAAQQKAEQEAAAAKKNPAGAATQFSGVGLVGTAIEGLGGKAPKGSNMPIGNPLSGGALFEQAGGIVKGATPKSPMPNPSDIFPKPSFDPFSGKTPKAQPQGEAVIKNPKIEEAEVKKAKLDEAQTKMEEAEKKKSQEAGQNKQAEQVKAAQQAVLQAQLDKIKATQDLVSNIKKPFGKF